VNTVAIDAGHGRRRSRRIGANGSQRRTSRWRWRKNSSRKSCAGKHAAGADRDGDFFVPLRARPTARAVKADCSCRSRALHQAAARGSTVFALTEHGATSVAARWWPKRKNEADRWAASTSTSRILSQTHPDRPVADRTINDCLKLGRAVLKEVGGVNTLHKAKSKGGFAVLKARISVDPDRDWFFSNRRREAFNDSAYRSMVDAIVVGVTDYFDKHPLTRRRG